MTMFEKVRFSISVSSDSGGSALRLGREIPMPVPERRMTRFENTQLRITPSFSQPTRMALHHVVRLQLVTVTPSQAFFSRREDVLARTMMQSSPQVMLQFETVTFRLQLM